MNSKHFADKINMTENLKLVLERVKNVGKAWYDCMEFNAVFKCILVISWWPVHLSMML